MMKHCKHHSNLAIKNLSIKNCLQKLDGAVFAYKFRTIFEVNMIDTLTVICPSRSGQNQQVFLQRMIHSVLSQKNNKEMEIEILICLDQDDKLDFCYNLEFVKVINSRGKSQAAALNAGLEQARGNYIAFLEDDDYWHPEFLSTCSQILQTSNIAFISSNQVEVMADGTIVGVNDFPTPSGWVLSRKRLKTLPFFDETFRWHLDNEYLGQLNNARVERCHLLERYAPHSLAIAARSRVGLVRIAQNSNQNIRLTRHEHEMPLVTKTVHTGSGMYKIANDNQTKAESEAECGRLKQKYSCIPH